MAASFRIKRNKSPFRFQLDGDCLYLMAIPTVIAERTRPIIPITRDRISESFISATSSSSRFGGKTSMSKRRETNNRL